MSKFKSGDKVLDDAGCECIFIGINPLDDTAVVVTHKGGIYTTPEVSKIKRVLEVGDRVYVGDKPGIWSTKPRVFHGMYQGAFMTTILPDAPPNDALPYIYAIHKDDVRG